LSIASFIASARTCEARGWTTEAFSFNVFGHRQLLKKKIVRRFGRGARGRAIPTYRVFFGIRAR